jgi:hypothetical protein
MALEAPQKPSLYESVVAGFKKLRGQLSQPSIRLSYFDEVLAVEHAVINERRRTRKDARHEEPCPPLQRLEPQEGTDGDHPLPETCPLPTPRQNPQMSVDPTKLDTSRTRARPIPCTAIGIALSGGGIAPPHSAWARYRPSTFITSSRMLTISPPYPAAAISAPA